MPTIANPRRGRPYEPRTENLGPVNPHAGTAISLALRLRVATARHELTRELSEGTDPAGRPELELRARQLTTPRNRRSLARSLRRAVAEARKPPLARARIVIIDRAAVIDAEETIATLIARLQTHRPVRAQGMAIVERMLTNEGSSPLYNSADSGALRQLVRTGVEALERPPHQSHEFPIAA